MLAFQVERLDHVACTASTIEEAIDVMEGMSPVDVVLTDFHLRSETCDRLVVACAERGIPVIVITGTPAEAFGVAALVPGTRVIGKPVGLAELADALGQAN